MHTKTQTQPTGSNTDAPKVPNSSKDGNTDHARVESPTEISGTRSAGSTKVGRTCRHSGYALKGLRDWWLSCGREPMKTGAKDELDRKSAMRGTITEETANGYSVQWDNGAISSCLSHMIEIL